MLKSSRYKQERNYPFLKKNLNEIYWLIFRRTLKTGETKCQVYWSMGWIYEKAAKSFPSWSGQEHSNNSPTITVLL